jgi:biopolymer transport protein ExbD
MNFKHRRPEEPEINLIPFIDVLLVILIFLMLSTTYSKYSELQITLPVADAERLKERPGEILVSVTAEGRYLINHKPVEGRSVDLLAAELRAAAAAGAGGAGDQSVVIVSADALAAHQAVINVLDAARRASLPRLTFATQVDGANR